MTLNNSAFGSRAASDQEARQGASLNGTEILCETCTSTPDTWRQKPSMPGSHEYMHEAHVADWPLPHRVKVGRSD